jgi:hypothetical protein
VLDPRRVRCYTVPKVGIGALPTQDHVTCHTPTLPPSHFRPPAIGSGPVPMSAASRTDLLARIHPSAGLVVVVSKLAPTFLTSVGGTEGPSLHDAQNR